MKNIRQPIPRRRLTVNVKKIFRVLELSVYCTAIEVTYLRQTDRRRDRHTDRQTEGRRNRMRYLQVGKTFACCPAVDLNVADAIVTQ